MISLFRVSAPCPMTVLFVPSLLPGPVVRETEKMASGNRSPFTSVRANPSSPVVVSPLPYFLSGPPVTGVDSLPWRVLFADTTELTDGAAAEAARHFLQRLGPELSRKLDAPVFLLDVAPNGDWNFTHWEAGAVANTGGGASPGQMPPRSAPWFSFLRRSSPLPILPSLRVWARENGLPLADAPLGRSSKRGDKFVDYDTVAGLERKGLLVETRRVWYRVTVDVPLGESDGGIMEAT